MRDTGFDHKFNNLCEIFILNNHEARQLPLFHISRSKLKFNNLSLQMSYGDTYGQSPLTFYYTQELGRKERIGGLKFGPLVNATHPEES